jgi:hypothetical protein
MNGNAFLEWLLADPTSINNSLRDTPEVCISSRHQHVDTYFHAAISCGSANCLALGCTTFCGCVILPSVNFVGIVCAGGQPSIGLAASLITHIFYVLNLAFWAYLDRTYDYQPVRPPVQTVHAHLWH